MKGIEGATKGTHENEPPYPGHVVLLDGEVAKEWNLQPLKTSHYTNPPGAYRELPVVCVVRDQIFSNWSPLKRSEGPR